MGLRINTNVASLQAQNRLGKTGKLLATTLERLSSGLRINSGKDDVVGLLKSESLRSQIRGISASELNISNAQSLLGVAEGSLNQLTEIAQQLREKVVQAADDSISSADRDNLTTAVADLQSEYSRLAAGSEFDGVKLLTGTFTNKSFQIGPNAGDSLSFSLDDSRQAAIGKVAVLTSITIVTHVGGTTTGFSDPAGIVINGVTLSSSEFTADGVSNVESDESAIAYVNAINSLSGESGVIAKTLANVVTFATYAGATALSTGDTLTINGVAIAANDYAASTAGANSLISAINTVTTQTGVEASLDASSSKIYLTASDGRNIDVVFDFSVSTTGIFGFSNASNSAISLYRGTFKLFSDSEFTLSGATAEISATTSVTLDTTTTLDNLAVSTSSNSETGIFILDNVIRQLQTRRANVGSKASRLDIAGSELQTRKENLSAAESVIRNADLAKETADLTTYQILQQAGVTVLSRATQLPQIALTLLQG